MGREIRLVPPNWDHPKIIKLRTKGFCEEFQPMYDRDYEEACKDWTKEFLLWQEGIRPKYCTNEDRKLQYWDWAGMPPEKAYYRPYSLEGATWFQAYETVSEGTPVTPPFETKEELIDYLSAHGDFWDQNRKEGAWTREDAEAFVKHEYAPSMVFIEGKCLMARDSASIKLKDSE